MARAQAAGGQVPAKGMPRMAVVTVIGTAGRPRADGGRRGCPV